jgi:hypothetical protein
MTAKKILLAAAAIAAVAAPGAAQARQGADDPAGHVRHSGADDVRGAHHVKSSTKSRSRARHHRRHGADDGPNHT